MKKTNTLIFVCAHNKQNILETQNIKPILVGAEISKLDLYPYKDNAGADNISSQNPNYNELTAMYWAWKNLPQDITNIGFFHYRRYLSLKDTLAPAKFLTSCTKLMEYVFGFNKKHIEELSQNFDIILPKKQKIKIVMNGLAKLSSMKEHFSYFNSKVVVDTIEAIILDKFPEYSKAMELSFNEKYCYFKSMFIMNKENFNNYMSFMFTILFEFEEQNKNNAITKQPRINGFVAERLINIYINQLLSTNKNIRIAEFKTLRKFHLDVLNSAYFNNLKFKLQSRLNLNYVKYRISIITKRK